MMRPRKHLLAGLALLVAAGASVFYFFAYPSPAAQRAEGESATSEFNDFLMSHPDPTVDAARARQLSHRVLGTPYGNHHDAFITLIDCGDSSSIPYLIRALRWQHPPRDGGGIVCTTAHCVTALSTITGQNFGTDDRAWNRWYWTHRWMHRN